ncbi:MAG: phosphotransferase [Porticoccaceae bacterium]
MIRDENLPVYLTCISEVLKGTIRTELQSDYSRAVIDAIVDSLGRLIAQTGAGREIAAQQLGAWTELEQALGALIPHAGPILAAQTQPETDPLRAVEQISSRLDESLRDEAVFKQLVSGLRERDGAAKTWFANASRTLNDLLQAVDEHQYRPIGRKGAHSVADNLEELTARLNAYLHNKYPGLPEVPIADIRILPGGQIKRTALFRLKDNEILPTRLVLRQDMDMEYTGTTVTDEFGHIERVHALGLPVPKPILVEHNPDVLGSGGCFMIMTEVQNAQPAGTYFSEDRAHVGHTMGPDFGREVAATIAKLHGLTQEKNREAGRLASQQRNDAIDKIRTTWHKQPKPPFVLGVELGLAWMDANPLGDDRPYCLRHGDLGSHNMMTRDGHLAALIDWELCGMGDPAADLAQLKMMLMDSLMPWEEFKKIYIAEGGPPDACDDHAVSFYCIWAYVMHTSMATSLWSNFIQGNRVDAQAAQVASHSMGRLTLYQSRALVTALDLVK